MKPPSMKHAEQRLREAITTGDLDAIETYSELVDLLDERERLPSPTLGDAARWYASLGLHVFPLSPRSKMPRRGTHGLSDASCDVELVAHWWDIDARANIGIATGHGVDVIDVDGELGELQLCRLLEEKPTLLSSALGIVSTPRPGGRHFYFAASGRPNSASRRVQHIDVRGLGGYVVAPPSTTELGAYVWHRALDVSALSAGAR